MDAIVYCSKPRKKINGTLFYSFEYYCFLKQFRPDLQFIIMSTAPADRTLIWSTLCDKYTIPVACDIRFMDRIDYMKAKVEHVIILDIASYDEVKDYLGAAKTVQVYCNKEAGPLFVNKPTHHTFYGWYDYQQHNVKTRLKLYKELHKIHENPGNLTFLSSPNADNRAIAVSLDLDLSNTMLKEPNTHHCGLFRKTKDIVYWHSGANDANNRLMVEAYIHKLPITVHFNGHTNDSVYERYMLIQLGKAHELFLTEDDVLVQDFLRNTNG